MSRKERYDGFWVVCVSIRQLGQHLGVGILVFIWLVSLAFAVTLPYWRSNIDVMGLGDISIDPIYQGDPSKPFLSLTVNVDWGQEVLPNMLSVLQGHNVKVTFFVTGRWAKQYPELVQQMAGEGHEVANHGMRHEHPTKLSDWDLTMLILDNHNLLATIIESPSPLFAPPYGEVDRRVAATARSLGYRTIMWSIDTIDWQEPSVETTIARVMNKAQNGSIVLMHPKPNTVRALPKIIEGLRRQGYQLLPVGELLEAMEGQDSGRAVEVEESNPSP
ncbi:MAG: polysaccharide deacetylase family protein [Firmicutes bacterium]|nr:polysaccharide deacetylase family protein [Bacillota bacterium]